MPSSPDQRRAVAEAVFARMRSTGVAIDEDPMVTALIEERINGWLGMPEVLERYQQLLKDRNTGCRAVAASRAQCSAGDHARMSTYDLLEQVEKLIAET